MSFLLPDWLARIAGKTDNLPSSPAATSDVTGARDSIKGASSKDLTQIDTKLGSPAGASIAADLATIASYVDTEVAAIKAKTDSLPAAPASQGDAQTGSTVPAADATTDAATRDVVGRKADTKAGTGTAANGTLSLMAYVKGLWDLLRGVTWSNLDTTVSSRLAASSYTAPDNTTIGTINTKAGSNTDAAGTTTLFAWMSRIYNAVTGATAPDNASIAAIKAKTDNLPSAPASQADAQAGATVPAADSAANSNARDVTGNKTDSAGTGNVSLVAHLKNLQNNLSATRTAKIDNLDATVSSRLAAASYTAPDNAGISTLAGRLTAGRATNLDNLDAAISTRASATDYTAARATKLDVMKASQQGVGVNNGGSTSYTTLVSVSGKAGRVRALNAGTSGQPGYLKVTIDGGTPFYYYLVMGSTKYVLGVSPWTSEGTASSNGDSLGVATTDPGRAVPPVLEFASSLLVEYRNSANGGGINGTYLVETAS